MLLLVPFARMFAFRRWAGYVICFISWAFLLYMLLHWKEFDVLPVKLVVFAAAMIPASALVLGKQLWRNGF